MYFQQSGFVPSISIVKEEHHEVLMLFLWNGDVFLYTLFLRKIAQDLFVLH